ncbi:MAG TPA: hydrogenase maturation protease [Solirubrobacteraceae bacterium]|nr:hydrogenase maturation protease [Solirubrobacteraceae bacterium]
MDGRAEIERPGPESVTIAGVMVRPGSRVVLRPRSTADILMRAVDGRRAIVEAIMEDLEDRVQLTVSLEDDPARSLGKGRGLGHRFFFAPDELEPLTEDGASRPPRRVLVAGIGNVFMADDGFGVGVAERLASCPLPEGVDVIDFGIRGMDLAFALNDGYHAAVLVDAMPRGQPPGTIEVLEPELDPDVFVGFEAHGMDPVGVLQFARQFGPVPDLLRVVGCEPQVVGDPEGQDVVAELSAPVRAAVDAAVPLIQRLVEELLDQLSQPIEGGHP